jgi:hypothetical protein
MPTLTERLLAIIANNGPYQKHGPWTGNSHLGQVFQFPLRNNASVTLLRLEEWGFPEVWTVALGIDISALRTVAISQLRVIGHIVAGVGGSSQQFDVNWNNGTVFSMPMNALTVSATIEPTTIPVNQSLPLSVTISRGPRGGCSWPSLTRTPTLVAAGADSPYEVIPAFAKRVELVASNDAANLYNVASYLQFSGNPNGVGDAIGRLPTNSLLLAQDGLAIPGEARSVSFHNGSGAGIWPCWTFKLGI